MSIPKYPLVISPWGRELEGAASWEQNLLSQSFTTAMCIYVKQISLQLQDPRLLLYL